MTHASDDAVTTYILAKDLNRPEWMDRAFTSDAELQVVVKSGTISFPPRTVGLPAITDVLVAQFNASRQNVRTLCVSQPPRPSDAEFACPWLVGFSDRQSGEVRVGCGLYEWSFQAGGLRLAERLRITIEHMEVLPAYRLDSVKAWLWALPYPWCPGFDASLTAPSLPELEPIVRYLERAATESA